MVINNKVDWLYRNVSTSGQDIPILVRKKVHVNNKGITHHVRSRHPIRGISQDLEKSTIAGVKIALRQKLDSDTLKKVEDALAN